ncbi:Dynactin subunit 4 like protein [Verticillium longisporum]|nr:Dynactin subunit 4 like protein [Verticillium longisporum]
MAPLTPYSYIQCPCSESSPAADSSAAKGEPDDDRTFDPRTPRANYSLYPLEYLNYCEDCHQIRCPRCVNEEIVTYYCPNCLFEVPSSNLKNEGNSLLAAEGAAPPAGPYILSCSYCQWSSAEIGIKFDKPNGIYQQLAKINNGGQARLTAKEYKERRKDKEAWAETPLKSEDVDHELHFAQLKTFYQTQLANSNPQAAGLSSFSDLGIASPGSLSRIMSIYTGTHTSHKQSRSKIPIMREALDLDEGLKVANLDDSARIAQLRESTIDDTRSKRCPLCRHIISKPEAKISNTRFRIRLVAGSYIPTIFIRPLHSEAGNIPSAMRPPVPQELWLAPLKPAQYLLTFKNPIFEAVKVTLATPAKTPGRFPSTVTVLCPQFEIDANTDMWDDALKGEERRRRGEEGAAGQQQPEPGKIWERGRNWVSVVVEVVPASLRLDLVTAGPDGGEPDRSPLKEDEDVLEIPMFVRIEWEAEAQNEVGAAPGKEKEAKEKRELAYWCVLGVGRISQT